MGMTHRLIVRQGDIFQTYVGEVVTWGPDMVTMVTITPDEYGHVLVRFAPADIVQQDVLAA